MKEKLKKHSESVQSYARSLKDVRTLGVLVFVGVLLLMTWSGIKVVETNYALQKQINELQQETDVVALQNETLRLRNEYYKTDAYLDLAARQNFGLALPGETEVLVPKDVALSKVTKLPENKVVTTDTDNNIPFYKKNFRSWVNFFLHREQTI